MNRTAVLRTLYQLEEAVRRITKRGKENYERELFRNVHSLWAGKLTTGQFIADMTSTVERGLGRAWHEGAAECGIGPDELSQQEITELQQLIFDQLMHIQAFADRIAKANQVTGGKLAPFKHQVSVWANRYDELRAQGQLRACADKKLEWVLNLKRITKKHCVDCLNMHGRVYRASVWRRNNVHPQSRNLACGGWQCGCGFRTTDKPITRGRVPKLQGQR